MPTDPSKQPQQILAIPPGVSGAELVTLFNDRIDQMNLAFAKFLQNPALGPADLGQAKIVNLADPKDDLDGVNLRTLNRRLGQPVDQQVTSGSGPNAYTIVFSKDGFPDDGETSPPFCINERRDGFGPVVVSLCADDAPVSDMAVNVTLEGLPILSADLVLPAGETGPVFSRSFKLGGFNQGKRVRPLIVDSGGAGRVSIELVMGKG